MGLGCYPCNILETETLKPETLKREQEYIPKPRSSRT